MFATARNLPVLDISDKCMKLVVDRVQQTHKRKRVLYKFGLLYFNQSKDRRFQLQLHGFAVIIIMIWAEERCTI